VSLATPCPVRAAIMLFENSKNRPDAFQLARKKVC
jgi:hypothetical protein